MTEASFTILRMIRFHQLINYTQYCFHRFILGVASEPIGIRVISLFFSKTQIEHSVLQLRMQSVDMHYSISSVEGWSSELRNTSNTFILHNRFSKYSCNCFKRSFHEHKDHILSFSLCKIHFESNEKEKSVDKHMFFIMIFFLQDLITLVREDILQIQLLCQ